MAGSDHRLGAKALFPKPLRAQRGASTVASARLAAKVRFVVATVVVTMAVLYSSLPEAATTCSNEGLSRESEGKGRLAIRSGDKWELFDQGTGILKTSEDGELCLAWEAPPYPGRRKQIVYVSTRHSDDQKVSVYRNASAPPFFYVLLPEWRRVVTDELFKEFHDSCTLTSCDSTSRHAEGWEDLRRWHETSFWFANLKSLQLVKGAIDSKSIHGAERLLVIAGARPYTSWIEFTSKVQKGKKLVVAVSYSGDKEPFVYRYVLDTEEGSR